MTEAPKKKILFITPQPYFQWRGSPFRVYFDTMALARQGYEVDLLTMPMGEDQPVAGVRHLRTYNPFRLKNLPIGPSFWKAVYDIILFFHAAALNRAHRYDVIHGVEDAGIIAAVLGRLTGARVVFEKHSDPRSYRRGALRNLVLFLYSKLEKISIRCADLVIATGPGLADHARRVASHGKVCHIFDIPSSLTEAEGEEVARLGRELRSAADELLVTYVGSFAVYQGIDLMFDSIPLVARRVPKARFVIIGGSPEEIAARKSRLAEQGVAASVSFVGKVPPDRLPNYLAASDVLLSPRIAGTNTPLKLLDYLKAGRAIVAADTEANRQILNTQTAMLTAATPAAFADGIVTVLENSDLRERLGAQGRGLVDSKYNFGEFQRLLGGYYGELGPRGRRRKHVALWFLGCVGALAEVEECLMAFLFYP